MTTSKQTIYNANHASCMIQYVYIPSILGILYAVHIPQLHQSLLLGPAPPPDTEAANLLHDFNQPLPSTKIYTLIRSRVVGLSVDALFLAALLLEKEDLFPHCKLVSHGPSPSHLPRPNPTVSAYRNL